MSHAANIRSRQRSLQAASPAKRRKIEPGQHSSLPNGLNGLLNGHAPTTPLSATPARHVRNTKRSATDPSTAVVAGGEDESAINAEEANGGLGTSDSGSSEGEDDDLDESDDSVQEPGRPDSSGDEGVDEPVDDARDTSASPQLLAKTAISISSSSDSGVEEQQLALPDSDAISEANEAPSFGDMLRSRGPTTIDVSMHDSPTLHSTSLTTTSANKALSAPSATSLGTVLTQALRTNDAELLESCFHVPNLEAIRATIERLPSPLAVGLLQRLAERMHKRPGRAGSLMVWVQWTVVAHGGHLASHPDAIRALRALYAVVRLRAQGLQPLLALKGKLDMLEAQMQMRRNVLAAAAKRDGADAEDEGVVYVEGEEDDDDEKALSSTSGDEGMLDVAGDVDGVDEDSDEDSDDAQLLDDEAEEASDDDSAADLSDNVDYDSADAGPEEDSSASEGEDAGAGKVGRR